MTIRLKPLPKIGGIEQQMFELVPMFAVSDAVTYASTADVVFYVPDGALIIGVGLIVDTAFNGHSNVYMTIGDGTTANKYATFERPSLVAAGSVFKWCMVEAVADGNITATVNISGSTAGSARVFVMYRPKATAQTYLTH